MRAFTFLRPPFWMFPLLISLILPIFHLSGWARYGPCAVSHPMEPVTDINGTIDCLVQSTPSSPAALSSTFTNAGILSRILNDNSPFLNLHLHILSNPIYLEPRTSQGSCRIYYKSPTFLHQLTTKDPFIPLSKYSKLSKSFWNPRPTIAGRTASLLHPSLCNQ